MLKWFESYLENRKVKVQKNHLASDILNFNKI